MLTLVTGLNGFTGRYIQAELEENGHKVVGLLSDLTDYEDIAKEIKQVQPEAVVHLAGIAFVGHGNAKAFYDVNLIGTRNLIVALKKYAPGIRSILIASSANVYGNRSEGILSEDTKPEPANDYAVSKLAMEQIVKLWIEKLPLFIVRPFNYTGIGQDEKFLIPKIVSHFKNKKTVIELGNLDVWREFNDIRLVANTYRKLLEKCPAGETLNVCTGKVYSLREVIALCEKITGHHIHIQVNNEFIRSNEARVLKGDKNYLNQTVDNLREFNLEETLKWMLEV
jgi:GDP-6-deoxy-D-talose 4-dehydrogenase